MKIVGFKGYIPKINKELIPEQYGQSAENCDFRQNTLKPLQSEYSSGISFPDTDFPSDIKRAVKLKNSSNEVIYPAFTYNAYPLISPVNNEIFFF